MRFFTAMVDRFVAQEDVTFNDNYKDVLTQLCKQQNCPPPQYNHLLVNGRYQVRLFALGFE